MLVCAAHVRIIALPHVRCACRSACGKGFELCVRKCVRMGNFLACDLRSHFFTCPPFNFSTFVDFLKRCTFQPFSHIYTYFSFDHLDLPALCAPIYRHRALAIEQVNYNPPPPPLDFMYRVVYYVCSSLPCSIQYYTIA